MQVVVGNIYFEADLAVSTILQNIADALCATKFVVNIAKDFRCIWW